jgi:hypothetical protein
MTFFPDMGTITMVAAGSHVRAIGWLDRDHPFCQGNLPPGFLERLQKFVEKWDESARLLGFGMFAGWHSCEFCADGRGTGDFGVPFGDVLFVAPTLILHYVSSHHYLPPADFVTAVMKSPTPGSSQYRVLIRRFQDLRTSPEDQQRIGNSIREWAVRESTVGRSNQPLQPTSGELAPKINSKNT